jgi:hypothetical protein
MRPIGLPSAITCFSLLAIGGAALPSSTDARPVSITHILTVAADPVGDYTWSFDTGDGGKVTGTLKILRSGTGYAAKLTSDRTSGEGDARSVTVDGDHVVVVIVGEYGEFTMDMTMKPAKIDAIWKLVGNETQQGVLNIERVKK